MNEIRTVGTKGYVQLVGCLGSDQQIADIASISHGKMFAQNPAELLQNLMKWGHLSPFEFAVLTFKVKVPMDIWRQWVRHRTGSILERSTRYTENECEYEPLESIGDGCQAVRKQFGRGTVDKEAAVKLFKEAHERAYSDYQSAIEMGVSREQARKLLPLDTYTEAYWKMDLRNLFHFLELRLSKGAQPEIQEYAHEIAYFINQRFPYSYSAWRSLQWDNGDELYQLNLLVGDNYDNSENRRAVEERFRMRIADGSIQSCNGVLPSGPELEQGEAGGVQG